MKNNSREPAQTAGNAPELDEMVRDFCAIGPRPKSEVRRRILEYASRMAASSQETAPPWLPIVQQIHSHKPILACPKCNATSDRQASKMCSGNEDNCPMDGADWIERIVKLNIETIASGFFGAPSSKEAKTPRCPTCWSENPAIKCCARCGADHHPSKRPDANENGFSPSSGEVCDDSFHVAEPAPSPATTSYIRGHYDIAFDIVGLFLEYRDQHGKSETEARHCAATEYEESEDLTQ